MLIKLIGGLMILASSSFLGLYLSKDCSKRPQELRELQSLLHMFENEVSYLSNVLSDAFLKLHKCSNFKISIIFKTTAEIILKKTGINASEAWELAVREYIGMTSLNLEDKNILISFGKLLGTTDLEGQIKNIRLTLSQLKLQEQKAEEISDGGEYDT